MDELGTERQQARQSCYQDLDTEKCFDVEERRIALTAKCNAAMVNGCCFCCDGTVERGTEVDGSEGDGAAELVCPPSPKRKAHPWSHGGLDLSKSDLHDAWL